MLRRIYKKLARAWYRLVTLKSSSRKIAAGFALGIFLSFTPTFGFQTVLALAAAAMLKVNPISCVLGVYLTNVFTVMPIYAFCYGVGRWVLGVEQVVKVDLEQDGILLSILGLGRRGLAWIGVQSVGAVLVGGVSGGIAYFLALFGVIRYRTARLNRRIRAMHRRIEQGQVKADQSSSTHLRLAAEEEPPPDGAAATDRLPRTSR